MVTTDPVILHDGAVTRDECARGVFIYALCEPETDERRYVGKTILDPRRRLSQHLQAAKKSTLPVGRWIRKRVNAGTRPGVEVLEYVAAGEDWASCEAFWIGSLPASRRLNLTNGGEGLAGLKIAGTRHGQRISQATKRGAWFSCEQCQQEFWRKPNEIKRGNCRFCSRGCYQASLRGVSRAMPSLAMERGVRVAAAKRRAQTHCKRGHPLSGPNLYQRDGGPRVCKTCRKIHKLKYRGVANG